MFERYVHHLKRWWWAVIVTAIVAAVASYGIAYLSPGPYKASSTLLVNLTQTPGTIVLDDVLLSERITATYEELIATRPILDEVASRLGDAETSDELRDRIDVSAVAGTQLIRITAEANDPDGAAVIAETVAQVFIEENNRRPTGSRPGTISVVESAEPPEDREGPSLPVRTVLGALAGASLGMIVIMGRTYFDRAVWDAEDLEGPASKIPLLGVLRQGDLIRTTSPRRSSRLPPMTEPYGLIAANVLTRLGKLKEPGQWCQRVAIMSASLGEGRTSIAARLGVATALEGHRVMLVDFDSRRPSLHEEFGLSNKSHVARRSSSTGHLSNAQDLKETARTPLSSHGAKASRRQTLPAGSDVGNSPVASCFSPAQETALSGLKVIACHPYNISTATGQLSVQEARAALERERAHSPEFIFFDTPPFRDGPNALVAAQLAHYTILVVEAKRTPVDLVASVAGQLEAMGLPALGLVINKR